MRSELVDNTITTLNPVSRRRRSSVMINATPFWPFWTRLTDFVRIAFSRCIKFLPLVHAQIARIHYDRKSFDLVGSVIERVLISCVGPGEWIGSSNQREPHRLDRAPVGVIVRRRIFVLRGNRVPRPHLESNDLV